MATRDLQTQGISVYASYANDVLSGYNASNSVTVKVRDIDKAGVVIDVAVNAGATSVWGRRSSGPINSFRREARFAPRSTTPGPRPRRPLRPPERRSAASSE